MGLHGRRLMRRDERRWAAALDSLVWATPHSHAKVIPPARSQKLALRGVPLGHERRVH